MTLRHNDCKDQGCYVKTLPNWGFLDACFPGKIKMGDLDGVVERHGLVFVCEWKKPGANLTTGQRIMFENMAKRGNTIAVCWGDVKTMEPEKIWLFHFLERTDIKNPSQKKLQAIARRWIRGVDEREAWINDYSNECNRRYGDKVVCRN